MAEISDKLFDRRQFLAAMGLMTAGVCVGCRSSRVSENPASVDKPNIIVILSDDQGYADASCYEHAKEVSTPNIDSLAKDGVRLTDGYVSCASCAPSRAGLLTGRYQQRFGFYDNPYAEHGVFRDQTTIAQLLKDAGYATAIVGKWHLGSQPENHPNSKGFDEFYGFLGGGHDYFNLEMKRNPIYRNDEIIVHGEKGYLTDVLSREAAEFVDRHSSRAPFFLYLAYNAVHKPEQAPEKYLRMFNTADERRDSYLARLASLDEGIGVVLAALKRNGVYDNTLVFFLSDNGGTGAGADMGILRGGKGSFYEGGIRVPFIVSWPRQLPAGKVCSEPIISLDVLPTAVAVAGGELPKDRIIDGHNMIPALLGKIDGPLHKAFFWTYADPATWAVRRGKWKLVCIDDRLKLYDLESDIAEKMDLAKQDPDLVRELKEAYVAWNKGLKQEKD